MIRRLGSWVRDAWLIGGIVLALIVVAEVGYRLQGAVRAGIRGRPPEEALRAEVAPPWMPAYQREEDASHKLQWRPYVYFRRTPLAGAFINVDSTGRRVTIPAGTSGPEIWLFGGSTMFGTFQRDAHTIPSVLAAKLSETGRPARVVNWGETGYVFTQEVVELLLQLRSGARPDVVVFYDGINDVVAALQSHAGVPQNEHHRARDFDVGRRLFAWEETPKAEARALGTLAVVAAGRSQILARLRQFTAKPQATRDPGVVADEMLRTYVETARLVTALGRAYGFRPVFMWQPTLHATRKSLGPEEAALVQTLESDGFQQRVRSVHLSVAARIDSTMKALDGAAFLNGADLFADHRGSIFADIIGHTYEDANAVIVGRLLPVVVHQLDSVAVGRGRAGIP